MTLPRGKIIQTLLRVYDTSATTVEPRKLCEAMADALITSSPSPSPAPDPEGLVARLRKTADALAVNGERPPPLYGLLHEAAHELDRREVKISHLKRGDFEAAERVKTVE